MSVIQQSSGKNWTLYNGDCCEVLKDLPDDSIDISVYSPPFAVLYIYSDSEADMGNCADNEEFFEHYKFLLPELLRVTVPGRLCIVHCKDLPKYANRDDTAGLIDFPGQLIAAHEACGWSYHSRVTIWKCPVTERERTNNNGLLHKTVTRDRSQLRMGMADFVLAFRKPPHGTLMSAKPVTSDMDPLGVPVHGKFSQYVGTVGPNDQEHHPSPFCRKTKAKGERGHSIDIWRRYAEPVWWDIDQTDVLNYKIATSDGERHICPLQLGVIERSIQIWSEPGDIVCDPFAGIGSTGVGAVRNGRRFVGVELKSEYFDVAGTNMRIAEEQKRNLMLFD